MLAALDLDVGERGPYLDEVCADDLDLRGHVDVLLQESHATKELGHPVDLGSGEQAFESLSGKRLAQYVVADRIGKGGMGEVYRARDTTLDRDVAVKVLSTDLAANKSLGARFEREAKMLATLNHPNIATLHGFESHEGTSFLVMELVDGLTLEHHIPVEGLAHEEFFELAIPLADALAEAHRHNVVHRDLKPGNVVVSSTGRLKVLDFGLAKLAQSRTPDSDSAAPTAMSQLTRKGDVVGTFPYMSPEQLTGKVVGVQSDVFSLGVVLYEMATGQLPFKGTGAELASAILRDTPPRVDTLNDQLSGALGALVARCLAKEPSERPDNAAGAHDELLTLSRDQHVLEPGGGTAGLRRRPWQAALILAAAAIAASVWLLPSRDLSTDQDIAPVIAARKMIAVLPFENLGATDDEFFAAGMTEEITSRLAGVNDLGVVSRSSANQYAKTDKSSRQIGAELGVAYLLTGSVRWARDGESSQVRITPRLIRVSDDTHMWSSTFDKELADVFELQSAIASQVVLELGVTLGEAEREVIEARPTENLVAYEAFLRGSESSGYDCEVLHQKIESLEKAVELDPDFATAWAYLARNKANAYQNCSSANEETRVQARRALDRAVQLAPTSLHTVYAASSYAMMIEKDYEAALTWIESVGAAVDRDARLLSRKASLTRRMGRWDEAIELYGRAMERDPRDMRPRNGLGGLLLVTRQFSDVLDILDFSLALHPEHGSLWQWKAAVHWAWRGDVVSSRATLEAAPVEVDGPGYLHWAWFWQEVYEGRHQAALDRLSLVRVDWIRNNTHNWPTSMYTAHAYQFLGESDRARDSFEAARKTLLAEIERVPASDTVRQALSIANAGLGNKEEAVADAIRVVDAWPIEQQPFFGVIPLENLALVYTMVGEYDLALETLEVLLSIPSVVTLPILELDPRWAPLHGHPRYQELKSRYVS